MRRSVLLLGLLAGCAAAGGAAVPQAARLSGETLTLSLSDGSVCRAPWKAEGGAGRLEGCGAGYDYRVTEVAKPNLLRQLFVGVTDALGAEGAVPPMAEVVVTGAGRDWRFVSPPPVD
nr:hypothetical protein [Gemmobacter straminiformis]